jgi:hypothetical protein
MPRARRASTGPAGIARYRRLAAPRCGDRAGGSIGRSGPAFVGASRSNAASRSAVRRFRYCMVDQPWSMARSSHTRCDVTAHKQRAAAPGVPRGTVRCGTRQSGRCRDTNRRRVRPAEHRRRPGPMACRRRLQCRGGLGVPGSLRDLRRPNAAPGDDRWCTRRPRPPSR